MAKTMKVEKADAEALLDEVGYSNVESWDEEKIAKKLGNIHTITDFDPADVKDKDLKKMAKEVLKAAEAGVKFTVEAGDDDDDDDDEKPAKKKSKAKPKKGKKAKDDEDDEDDDDKPAKKGKKGKKGGGKEDKKPKKKSKREGPGVIASIAHILATQASKTKPMSKKKLHKLMVKKFPDRAAESLRTTIDIQVPSRLRVDREIIVDKNEDGYYINLGKHNNKSAFKAKGIPTA